MEFLYGITMILLAIACVIISVQLNENKRLRGIVKGERESAIKWQKIAYENKTGKMIFTKNTIVKRN